MRPIFASGPLFTSGMAVLCAVCASGPNGFAAPAPPPRDLAAVCARSPCRTMAEEFRLRDAAGGTFIFNTSLVPYADEGHVTIFAGETLHVAVAANAVGAPRFLRSGAALAGGMPGSLALQLTQTPGRADMVLAIQSVLDSPIAFDAMLYVPSPNGMGTRKVAGCIAAANTLTKLTWPYPIATTVLSNFRLAAGVSSDCR